MGRWKIADWRRNLLRGEQGAVPHYYFINRTAEERQVKELQADTQNEKMKRKTKQQQNTPTI